MLRNKMMLEERYLPCNKYGNDFITNIVLKDKEKPLDDLQITARFIRKKKS